MSINYISIGKQIRNVRIKKKMTQAKLAEKSGIEPSNLSHIERATTKLSLPTLLNITNALGASLDEIVYGSLLENTHISNKHINELLSDCSPEELVAITEIIKTTKKILRNSKRKMSQQTRQWIL